MDKWIKYHWALIQLARRDTREKLIFLSATVSQIFYVLATGLVVFITRIYFKLDNISIVNIFVSLLIALFSYLIINSIVFLFHLLKSKKRLLQEIGVNRFSDFDPSDSQVEFSEWDTFGKEVFSVLYVSNKSSYPLIGCMVKIKKVANIEDSSFTYPKEDRPLEWFNHGTGRIDIEVGEKIKPISVIRLENNKLRLFTYPANPYKLDFGNYLIDLEFTGDYWWKKVALPIKVEVIFNSLGFSWKMI